VCCQLYISLNISAPLQRWPLLTLTARVCGLTDRLLMFKWNVTQRAASFPPRRSWLWNITMHMLVHRLKTLSHYSNSSSFGNQAQNKVKVKLTLKKGHEGPEGKQRYSSTLSLTSALDLGGWSKPRPGRFIPRGKRPGTYCTGGWVCPRAGLEGCGKFRPHRDLIPGPSRP
jgi:hypothetical protein